MEIRAAPGRLQACGCRSARVGVPWPGRRAASAAAFEGGVCPGQDRVAERFLMREPTVFLNVARGATVPVMRAGDPLLRSG